MGRDQVKVLILGGTREARELAEITARAPDLDGVSSLAGRVRKPVLPAGDVRIGGFGGVVGLRKWLVDNDIRAVLDATHPFAETISAHAAAVAGDLGIPIAQLRRPGWLEQPGDRWLRVPHLTAAAAALDRLGERVFLTVGRQSVAPFTGLTRPWFLVRALEAPSQLPPRHELLLARGPFTLPDERQVLAEYGIDVLVCKDSGGEWAAAKLTAARERGIPVVLVQRPAPAGVTTVTTVAAAAAWLRELPSGAVT